MRLGIATTLQHSSPEEWACKHADLGCRSIVFPLDYTSEEGLIEQYVQAAREYDLTIAEVGAWGSPLSLDKETCRAAKEKCVGQLKLADRIGANCCVNITGSLGEIWCGPYEDDLKPEMWNRVVESLQEIIDEANPQNTYYSIEAMPWMIPMNPDEYVKLIEDVNRKQFGVHLDIVNWISSPEKYFGNGVFIEECFNKLNKNIRSCHMKDIMLKNDLTFQLQEVQCGKGSFDLEKYAEQVNKIDDNIPMLIEHLKTEEQYREAFAYVGKRLEAYMSKKS